MTYTNTNEFMDCHINNSLNEFNEKLFNDYIDCNFYDEYFEDCKIDITYKDGCYCDIYHPNNDDDIDDSDDSDDDCKCENNICYFEDKYMHDKLPMFPKNMYIQKYFESIMNKRKYKNKIFYYLPNNYTHTFIQYIDENIKDTVDIYRNITYFCVNNVIIYITDELCGFWGVMFFHCHIPNTKYFDKYIIKYNDYIIKNKIIS